MQAAAITATGTRMPYGITQCYLPPGRGDIPAFTPAKAGSLLDLVSLRLVSPDAVSDDVTLSPQTVTTFLTFFCSSSSKVIK